MEGCKIVAIDIAKSIVVIHHQQSIQHIPIQQFINQKAPLFEQLSTQDKEKIRALISLVTESG